MKKIPDKWEDYSAIGKPITGTRFIAFKVPLAEKFNNHLSPDVRPFTPDLLLEEIRRQGCKLGLVIDLTNTRKYYHEDLIRHLGVKYTKIFTEGHRVPSAKVKHQFFDAVDNFLKENDQNSDLIGVHCTHGINRTGYLICRYMINRLDKTPIESIQAFNEGRGHVIERQNYIDDLLNLNKKTEFINNDFKFADDDCDDDDANDEKLTRGWLHFNNNHPDNNFQSYNNYNDNYNSDNNSIYNNNGYYYNNTLGNYDRNNHVHGYPPTNHGPSPRLNNRTGNVFHPYRHQQFNFNSNIDIRHQRPNFTNWDHNDGLGKFSNPRMHGWFNFSNSSSVNQSSNYVNGSQSHFNNDDNNNSQSNNDNNNKPNTNQRSDNDNINQLNNSEHNNVINDDNNLNNVNPDNNKIVENYRQRYLDMDRGRHYSRSNNNNTFYNNNNNTFHDNNNRHEYYKHNYDCDRFHYNAKSADSNLSHAQYNEHTISKEVADSGNSNNDNNANNIFNKDNFSNNNSNNSNNVESNVNKKFSGTETSRLEVLHGVDDDDHHHQGHDDSHGVGNDNKLNNDKGNGGGKNDEDDKDNNKDGEVPVASKSICVEPCKSTC